MYPASLPVHCQSYSHSSSTYDSISVPIEWMSDKGNMASECVCRALPFIFHYHIMVESKFTAGESLNRKIKKLMTAAMHYYKDYMVFFGGVMFWNPGVELHLSRGLCKVISRAVIFQVDVNMNVLLQAKSVFMVSVIKLQQEFIY